MDDKKLDNGGHVFPLQDGFQTDTGYHAIDHINFGMTLLDWFAGEALSGLSVIPDNTSFEDVANWAYDQAEAMVTEKRRREKVS